MKKVLLAIGGGIGVIVGAILIWKFVLPFIGFVFQPIWRFLSALLNRKEHNDWDAAYYIIVLCELIPRTDTEDLRNPLHSSLRKAQSAGPHC